MYAIRLQEEALEFAFKVRGEDLLADSGADLIKRPETTAIEFFG